MFPLPLDPPPKPLDYELEDNRSLLLSLRVLTLLLLVALLVLHMRTVRVFRWEQSVSGGVAVTYVVVVLGLALCVGLGKSIGVALQVYLCGMGAILLALNAAVIWRRWRVAGDMTHAVAELLHSLGMPVERHVILKVCLSAASATALVADLVIVPLLVHRQVEDTEDLSSSSDSS